MPYVTSFERLARKDGRKEGREEGRQEGREQGLEEGLREGLAMAEELRFGVSSRRVLPRIQALHDLKRLRAAWRALRAGKSLEDLERLME